MKSLLRKIMSIPDGVFALYHQPMLTFNQKTKLYIERDRYIIKTAENNKDLAQVLRLRHQVFYEELLEKKMFMGIDLDKYDFTCDHLIIIDKKTNQYIGTYRLISSTFSKRFYSESEFHIDSVLRQSGPKLELGRACVHKDFRNGVTIALLWRGITEYMKLTETRYLFGCSSIRTTDPTHAALIYKYLQSDLSQETSVYPKKKYAIKELRHLMKTIDLNIESNQAKAIELIPPLVKSYLNMGAKICGEPALDKKFQCIDLLTIFDAQNSCEAIHRKYKI